MKTSNAKFALTVAAALLAVAASGAEAGTRLRTVDSLVSPTQNGGEIIVALTINCGNGSGNYVMETNRDTDVIYQGCAHLEGNRVIVSWSDGTTYSYAPNAFRRTHSVIAV